MMPKQQPGKSNQSVQTPPDLIHAVKSLLNITDFGIDLAADAQNTQCQLHFNEADDSLQQHWYANDGICWLNPPFSSIGSWVAKCNVERDCGASIAVLVPVSTGTKWWASYVDGSAQVYFLGSRVTFVGHKTPYPKDLALLLYRPGVYGGYTHWNWKSTAKVAYTPNQHGEPVLSVTG